LEALLAHGNYNYYLDNNTYMAIASSETGTLANILNRDTTMYGMEPQDNEG